MQPNFELYQGDSLAVLRTLADQSVDAVITDPPYSSGGIFSRDRTSRQPREKYQRADTAKTYPTFFGETRDQRSFGYWMSLWLSECLRIARPGAPIAVFTDWRQLPTTTDALQAAGWTWLGIVPWHKSNPRPQRGRFTNQCEYVVWGSNGQMPQQLEIGVIPGWISSPIIHVKHRQHMTEKPLLVMEHLLRICAPGGTILDPFVGSGKTGVAALRNGFRFVGIEQSSEYAAIAKAQLQQAIPVLTA